MSALKHPVCVGRASLIVALFRAPLSLAFSLGCSAAALGLWRHEQDAQQVGRVEVLAVAVVVQHAEALGVGVRLDDAAEAAVADKVLRDGAADERGGVGERQPEELVGANVLDVAVVKVNAVAARRVVRGDGYLEGCLLYTSDAADE